MFAIIIVLVVLGRGLTTISFLTGGGLPTSSVIPKKSTMITVKTLTVEAQIASSADERKMGLSGRDSLLINQGLFFVFESKGVYNFWMKDMKFAIDIIWIDESKKIVDIAANVPIEVGKKDRELTIYRPESEAKYVLEVNAGLSKLHGLAIGDKVSFEF